MVVWMLRRVLPGRHHPGGLRPLVWTVGVSGLADGGVLEVGVRKSA
jgi:hypothetical protein